MAEQLGHPVGPIGVAIGEEMHRANKALNEAAVDLLAPDSGDTVLEIGFGNGRMIPALLQRAPGLKYVGLDLSATMVNEARRWNKDLLADGQATILLGDVADFPLPDASVTKCLAVNTFYFWSHPLQCLGEIRRVLTAEGVAVLAAMTPDTAANFLAAQHGFRIYSDIRLHDLLEQAGFISIVIRTYVEIVRSATSGVSPGRAFYLVRAQNSSDPSEMHRLRAVN